MVGSMNNLGTHLFALDDRSKLKARTFVCRTILECNLILIHHVCGDLATTKVEEKPYFCIFEIENDDDRSALLLQKWR